MDHFLPYEFGRRIKIRPSRLSKGVIHRAVGTFLPLPVNNTRNANAASIFKGPNTANTIDTFIDCVYNGFIYLELKFSKWRECLCEILPHKVKSVIREVKKYTCKHSLSDVAKNKIIKKL